MFPVHGRKAKYGTFQNGAGAPEDQCEACKSGRPVIQLFNLYRFFLFFDYSLLKNHTALAVEPDSVFYRSTEGIVVDSHQRHQTVVALFFSFRTFAMNTEKKGPLVKLSARKHADPHLLTVKRSAVLTLFHRYFLVCNALHI
jgi:hypothetical protein